jgi:magnesium transporter
MLDKNLLKGDILEALMRSPPGFQDLEVMFEAAFPADVAEILEDLEPDQQLTVLRCLNPEMAADVLGAADEDVQKDLLRNLLTHSEITGILNEIDPDEGADLVALLPFHEGKQALSLVEPEQAEAIRNLATYDPETAGGIMTSEFVTVSPDLTIAQALQTLKSSLDVEDISNVYVAGDKGELLGVMSVRDILEASPQALVRDVMTSDVMAAHVDEDQEDASRRLDRYEFTSLPVVEDGGELVGVITIDDAMDVLEEEAEEDIAMIAGSGFVTVRDSALTHLRFRLPWLLITLGGGLLAAFLVQSFDGTLASVPQIVFFMPVMVGMAGNVGIQSSTVLVRGFATGEMAMDIAGRTLRRQLLVGLSVGLICGSLTGSLAALLTGRIDMGYTVMLSMAVGIVAATAAGTCIPILCHRLGVDPAVASGPVITTLNDLTGLLIYFAVATLILLGVS